MCLRYNTDIHLFYVVVPLLSNSSGNTSVLNGSDNVTVYCIFEADPVADIDWFFDGQRLNADSAKYEFSSNKVQLIIKSVSFSDSGLYSCVATNVFGTSNSTVLLKVQGGLIVN